MWAQPHSHPQFEPGRAAIAPKAERQERPRVAMSRSVYLPHVLGGFRFGSQLEKERQIEVLGALGVTRVQHQEITVVIDRLCALPDPLLPASHEKGEVLVRGGLPKHREESRSDRGSGIETGLDMRIKVTDVAPPL